MNSTALLNSISEIYFEQYEAMRNTSNSIICYESKIDNINNDEDLNLFTFHEGCVYDSDGDELYITEYSNESVKPTNNVDDKSKYDFKGHDATVGGANIAVAKIIREIFDYSKIYHHGTPSAANNLLYGGSMFGSNLAKYQKTVDLMNMVKDTQQNFCKIYYACDNVGLCKGQKAYVFFAEMTLPSGTFYFSWHLMRDGVKSKNTNKNTPKNKICNVINEFIPDGSKVIKFGKSKIEEYNNMEQKYGELYKQRVNGKVVLTKLIQAFNLPD